MAYPKETPIVFKSMGYRSQVDFEVGETRDGEIVVQWHHVDPLPTDQEVNDYFLGNTVLPASAGEYAGQLFSDYYDSNGRDPVKTKQRQITRMLQNADDDVWMGLRLIVKMFATELNLTSEQAVQKIEDLVAKEVAGIDPASVPLEQKGWLKRFFVGR